MNKLRNFFIDKLMSGYHGSNVLGAVLVAVQASNIDYMKAFAGFNFEKADEVEEAAKLVLAIVTGIFTFFVGRKKHLEEKQMEQYIKQELAKSDAQRAAE